MDTKLNTQKAVEDIQDIVIKEKIVPFMDISARLDIPEDTLESLIDDLHRGGKVRVKNPENKFKAVIITQRK